MKVAGARMHLFILDVSINTKCKCLHPVDSVGFGLIQLKLFGFRFINRQSDPNLKFVFIICSIMNQAEK